MDAPRNACGPIAVKDGHHARIAGKRVMVTGAGGSIGSELVAQIAGFDPARLCLIDSCEHNLYQVSYATAQNHPKLAAPACICDIRDETAMRDLFVRENPDIVFHAAALKHVPLLEDHNVIEAVRTNVLGTKITLDLCCAFGADFVMISTDKAVNPSSCMGLTKRVAELYVHDRALRFSGIRTSLVRFGNVVGSSGSVVPLFQRQIQNGGPVTVTHPKMTRFLMSIDGAVRLVLAASSLPQTGFALYILDMGKPVLILDLAVEMIRRAGLTPFKDIGVEFVGMRPGEKLHEVLNYDWEILTPTEVEGVRSAAPQFDPAPKLQLIDSLLAAANARNVEEVKRKLIAVVPEFVRTRRLGECRSGTRTAGARRGASFPARLLENDQKLVCAQTPVASQLQLANPEFR
ncbi:O-antigen biosynthesis protein WbqV [Rhodoblastus acidophilus]|uniref:polysaccharide biosynthesis protein n=1 Tax=Rhodoblastus acidophilus TaxID=1074 RepID=UPI002224EBEA|nr:polysaccharide biosynthesis protein [Rhodoblastus acidophilus]MCW2285382.1 O-antigen biosynthesis protein WbqV [Rhodoblastus acidophilus]MCW2334370.1 O-antigen biosynthesis protein WbqV [Rhodoblastus acidophilus]